MWRAHSFFFPTPRRLRRPNHPNLQGGRGGQESRAGQGKGAGQGRAGHVLFVGSPKPLLGGERIGSLCAMEVEGLKRRPPTEVGGLGFEFRV